MIHELKILPQFFKDVLSGEKTFEVRKNDRPFKKGDMLALNEFDGQYYTGNSCIVYIDYILNNAEFCKKDMVIMAIKPCKVFRFDSPFKFDLSRMDYAVPLSTNNDKEKEREE